MPKKNISIVTACIQHSWLSALRVFYNLYNDCVQVYCLINNKARGLCEVGIGVLCGHVCKPCGFVDSVVFCGDSFFLFTKRNYLILLKRQILV